MELGCVMVLQDSRGVQRKKSWEQRQFFVLRSSNKTQINSKASSIHGLKRSL